MSEVYLLRDNLINGQREEYTDRCSHTYANTELEMKQRWNAPIKHLLVS